MLVVVATVMSLITKWKGESGKWNAQVKSGREVKEFQTDTSAQSRSLKMKHRRNIVALLDYCLACVVGCYGDCDVVDHKVESGTWKVENAREKWNCERVSNGYKRIVEMS